jgi:putative transposase
MSRRVSPSVKRSYGVQRVTRVWGTSRATYRHRGQRDEPRSRRRPGPVGPMPEPALVEAIRALLAASPFHGEGHRKIWARLRFAGIRTSKRRVLRLMREHGLLAPGRVGRSHGPRAHDGTIRTERVDAMWGTDLTSTMTGEGQASIFVTVDHCSTECVGIHAARRATRFEALEPLRQGVRACFGAFGAGVAGGLELRHDHGSQFVADDYQRELAFLGIASSPAFVREPEGNGCVERFIRTLKENLLWVRRFDTIEELRLALHAFQAIYNQTWIVERHGYQTPAAVRAAQLAPLPAAARFAEGLPAIFKDSSAYCRHVCRAQAPMPG